MVNKGMPQTADVETWSYEATLVPRGEDDKIIPQWIETTIEYSDGIEKHVKFQAKIIPLKDIKTLLEKLKGFADLKPEDEIPFGVMIDILKEYVVTPDLSNWEKRKDDVTAFTTYEVPAIFQALMKASGYQAPAEDEDKKKLVQSSKGDKITK